MKTAQKLLFFLSVIVFISLLYISMFNVFQTDDYIYSAQSRDLGFWQSAADLYKNWGGRYFSNTLLCILPAGNTSFNWLPKIYPVLLWSIFIFSVFLNFREYFKMPVKECFVKAFIFFLFYTAVLSSISEHYFWLCATTTHYLPVIFFSFYILLLSKNQQQKTVSFPVVLLTGLMIGSNEILGFCVFFVSGILALKIKSKAKKIEFLIVIICLVASYAAPGNFVRAGTYEKGLLYRIFAIPAIGGINFLYLLLKTLPLIPILMVVFCEELQQINSRLPSKEFRIIFVFLLSLFLLSGVLLLLLNYRALETAGFFTLLLMSLILFRYCKNLKNFWAVSVVFLLLPPINLFTFKEKNMQLNYNVFKIVDEAVFSPLKEYEQEIKKRHQKLSSCRSETIELEPVKAVPKVLYFEEPGTKTDRNYINQQLERFYKLKSVSLKEE